MLPHSPRPTAEFMYRLFLLFPIAALTLCSGCGQRSKIREYTVEREAGKVLTSEVFRSQFPTIPLRWEAPKSWRVADADEFSRMAWTAGPVAREARITITDLPGTAGVEPQVIRWRRQLSLPAVEGAELMQDAEEIEIGTWIEVAGPTDSILATIVPHEDKLWVVRLRGPNATVLEEKNTFRSFCESLSFPKAQGS
jgi:hypothetical protein